MPSRARVGRVPAAVALERGSSVDFGFCVAMLTGHRLEEVEVAAEVRLLHVTRIEESEATLELRGGGHPRAAASRELGVAHEQLEPDRKSTRLNSSHSQISYAVFCLKKKKKIVSHLSQVHCSLTQE